MCTAMWAPQMTESWEVVGHDADCNPPQWWRMRQVAIADGVVAYLPQRSDASCCIVAQCDVAINGHRLLGKSFATATLRAGRTTFVMAPQHAPCRT